MKVESNTAYKVSRALHWACAILYVFLAISMPIALDIAETGSERKLAHDIHLTFAFIFIILLAFRFYWMYSTGEKGLRTEFVYKWQYYMARINHTFLYALMVLSPLSGVVAKIFTGKPVLFWAWTLLENSRSIKDRDWVYYAGEIHSFTIETFYVLLFLHLVGAMLHVLQKAKDKRAQAKL